MAHFDWRARLREGVVIATRLGCPRAVAQTLLSAASRLISTRFRCAPDLPFGAIFMLCCALDKRMPTHFEVRDGAF